LLSYHEIRNDKSIRTYIQRADESLVALGYTEHSFAHVAKVAETAGDILKKLGYSPRDQELAKIAGFLHDIGNLVNRVDHAQSGAVMAFRLLDNMGGDPDEIATIITAIGNHDEATAVTVNPIAAALILADKTDVRRSRVRNQDATSFDIHDRVNFSARKADLKISDDLKIIELSLDIDTAYCSVMDYFEIFLNRMILCRKAAETLGLSFQLTMNGQRLL
jgi:metal-dependent HD superfamily phosphatase/phosphodiesterase